MAAPDIFLSYNREDQARAKQFADAFAREGLNVWWDATLKSGEAYDEVTENALRTAKAVVVLWSPRSVGSRWVRAEATLANRNKTLVPVTIEACERPIMFELTHTAELSHWKGDPKDAAWLAFVSDLKHFVGKGASVAPPMLSLQTTAQPALKSRRSILIGGIAAIAIAIAATTLLVNRDRQATTPIAQRTAFFGFTATTSDPIALEIATTATDETFKTFNQTGIDTASRTETRDVAFRDQTARARDVGARYAVSGEVRNNNGQVSVSMRMDDVVSRNTVWEETLIGGEADRVSLPYRATGIAAQMASCYIRYRENIKHEDEKRLKPLARLCKAIAQGNWSVTAERAREAAAAAPDSAYLQATLSLSLNNALPLLTSASEQIARRQEIDAATKRALTADPANAIAKTVLAFLAIDDGKSMVDSEKSLSAVLSDNPNDALLNNYYGVFLGRVGRYRDALPYYRAADRLQPLHPSFSGNLQLALAFAGQTREAAKLFEETNERLPTPGNWNLWMMTSVTLGVSDPEQVLKVAPATISGDRLKCWRDAISATTSMDLKVRRADVDRARECVDRGIIFGRGNELAFLASLGEVDAAFAVVRNTDQRYGRFQRIGRMLTPAARLAHADPRFLPLMKEFGIYQYWLDTRTHPDICDLPDERDFPLCVALRADQEKKQINQEASKR